MTKTVGFYGGKFAGVVHLGHVYAMTVASSMVDELHVVVCYDEEWEKEEFKNSKIPYVDANQRVRWWKEITSEMPNVIVSKAYNKNTMEMSDWKDGAEEIKDVIGRDKEITHIFSSESIYEDFFKECYGEHIQHIVIDENREHYPISATKIRNFGFYCTDTWDFLPKVVQRDVVKKVVVVGSESTGKTTISKHLARIFNTEYVEETGRTFYDKRKIYESELFNAKDFIEFTYEQKHLEFEAKKVANKVMFVDTEALTTLRFARQYLGKDIALLKEMGWSHQYDLWLLMDNNIPFVEDGTRGYVKNAQESQDNLIGILDEFGIEYKLISGDFYERLTQAEDAVDNLLFNF